jgi:hypothetical protein
MTVRELCPDRQRLNRIYPGFKIAVCAIGTLTRRLMRTQHIPGTSVFQYGDHLAIAIETVRHPVGWLGRH